MLQVTLLEAVVTGGVGVLCGFYLHGTAADNEAMGACMGGDYSYHCRNGVPGGVHVGSRDSVPVASLGIPNFPLVLHALHLEVGEGRDPLIEDGDDDVLPRLAQVRMEECYRTSA
jgi:hypothetical protein